MAVTPFERLKRRHARLDHELAAERARHRPDDTRVVRLKKLKLAVKDRMLHMAAALQPA
jgi:hypothetical protein